MTSTLRIISAGFIATAISFGPARMGFGLFLPTFRESFALSTTQSGLIASLAFFTFLVALPAAAWLDERVGQRGPIMMGTILATAGFLSVSMASTIGGLATGVAMAGASAGLCWSPFNDAAERTVPGQIRPTALSAVSTGTTVGVAATGAFFLSVSFGAIDWRFAWSVFAMVGILAGVMTWYGVPAGRRYASSNTSGKQIIFHKSMLPLYGAAICFGVSNAVYISFAADHVVASGGLPGLRDTAAPAVIFIGYGVCGLLGLATGLMEAKIGLFRLLGLIFVAFASSLILVALQPGAWSAVLVSAGLHGAAVMMISAVLSFWSLRLFPGQGSLGFTAALIGVAASSVFGPGLAGVLADATTMKTAFLITALIPLSAAILFVGRAVYPRP